MKINGTNIGLYEVTEPIGAFDIAFKFLDSNSQVVREIIEWLSNNCTENFIVTESISYVVAGGYSNNKTAFENGLFNMSRKNKQNHKLLNEYEIRLDKADLFHFRLRWIDESPADDDEE